MHGAPAPAHAHPPAGIGPATVGFQPLEPTAPDPSNDWKPTGRVFTNGCFDLLHAGHVDFLERAAALGETLTVLLNSDASIRRIKREPIVPEGQRVAMLAALRCVDHVILFDDDTPEALIRELRPNVLVKGGDWTRDQIAGADFIESYGGRVLILPRDPEAPSTSALIAKIQRTA